MSRILTFIASSAPLKDNHLQSAVNLLDIDIGEVSWLAEKKAVDIRIPNSIDHKSVQQLRTLLNKDKIDIFYTNTANRRKKLLIADMDSTIVTSETLDELAEEAGIKDKISTITDRAMRGELNFFDAIRERVGLLEGLSTDALTRTLEQIEISKGAKTLVKTMNAHGGFCALVSGGFTSFTESIASQLEFNAHHGNTLGIENNALTGEVIDPILDKETKLQLLMEYAQKLEIGIYDTVAIGDGANDLPMLEAAGLGIGYHPKPLLEERLINCIRHTDLTSVLYAQGYKQEEFSI